jgi:hypothetical protein
VKNHSDITEDEARCIQLAYGVDIESARLVLSLMDRLGEVEMDSLFFTSLGNQVRSWLDNPEYKLPLSVKQIRALANEGF